MLVIAEEVRASSKELKLSVVLTGFGWLRRKMQSM